MNFLPVKIPEIFKTVFPNRTWYIDTDEKVIYLTFDDGLSNFYKVVAPIQLLLLLLQLKKLLR